MESLFLYFMELFSGNRVWILSIALVIITYFIFYDVIAIFQADWGDDDEL